jgi:hypothetical protein
MTGLGLIAGLQIAWWWAPIVIGAAVVLLIQGVIRLNQSFAVIQQAVVARVFEHPLVTRINELIEAQSRRDDAASE